VTLMVRWVAAALWSITAALTWTATASAEPPVPQPGTPCEPNLAAAMTWPTEAKVPLECTGGSWQPVETPYPLSDRWVSFGPAMRLHGEGLRNKVIDSGDWTATPLTLDARCRAEQLPNVPGVGVGPPSRWMTVSTPLAASTSMAVRCAGSDSACVSLPM